MDTITQAPSRYETERAAHAAIMERAEGHVCREGEAPRTYKHGVFRAVDKHEVEEVLDAITYFMGDRAYWAKSQPRGGIGWDIEYVYQCTGGPAERCSRPWEWCGESILFEDLHDKERENRAAADKLRPGQAVRFEYDGQRYAGLVSRINAKSVTVIVDGYRTWRVSASMLELA